MKKHSDIVRNYEAARSAAPVRIEGDKEKTPTGFRIKGFDGKSMETYFEAMLEGGATPTMMHEKKDRIVHILTGKLVVVTDKPRVRIAGDEIVLERGKAYRLMAPLGPAEFRVVQNAKYEATLEILDEEVAQSVDVDPALLRPAEESTIQPRTRRSKAKQILMKQAQGKTPSPQVIESKVGRAPSTPAPQSAGTNVMGSSPMPSMGRFNPDEAG